jgi:hypothetical protein
MFSRRAILRSLLALPFASLFVKKAEARDDVPDSLTLKYAQRFFDDHVPTGIPELDNALGGGFPKGKVTSVTAYDKFHLDALFIKHGAKLFGGEYGGHYVSMQSALSISDQDSVCRAVRNQDHIREKIWDTLASPVDVYKACDAALAANEAVVFMTSRTPMVGHNYFERYADVYVVFGFDKCTHFDLAPAKCKTIEQFSVLTATKKF